MTAYNTAGICARSITIEIAEDNTISRVTFMGGCSGNLSAISRLVTGKDAREIADSLKGNRCGSKNTSCADQLALAIYHELDSRA